MRAGVLICRCRCFCFDNIAIEYSVIDNSGKNARRSGGYSCTVAADALLPVKTCCSCACERLTFVSILRRLSASSRLPLKFTAVGFCVRLSNVGRINTRLCCSVRFCVCLCAFWAVRCIAAVVSGKMNGLKKYAKYGFCT